MSILIFIKKEKKKKRAFQAGHWWLTLAILATWETEIVEKIMV
jgi:hypothetical protein